jgi:uncharacterized protein YerC
MKANEIIEGIKNLKELTGHNSMGCSENWYNFYYAMKETFTPEEIQSMTDRECELLERLAYNIQEGLY